MSWAQPSGLEWRERDWFRVRATASVFFRVLKELAELQGVPAGDGFRREVHYHKAKETCSVFCGGFVVWLCRVKSFEFRVIRTTFQLGIVRNVVVRVYYANSLFKNLQIKNENKGASLEGRPVLPSTFDENVFSQAKAVFI